MRLFKNFIDSPITSLTGVVVLISTVVALFVNHEFKMMWDGAIGFCLSVFFGVTNEKKIVEYYDKVVNKFTK